MPSLWAGARINNPGRYLVLLPPINGANRGFGNAPTSLRIPAILTRRWIPQRLSITCPAST